MTFFTEWKTDREMIEDGVFGMVLYLPTNPSAAYSYMMLFEAPEPKVRDYWVDSVSQQWTDS
jgi:hypothetical protein